jgi:hypothetical protein
VLIATLTAERLVGWVTGGSKEKAFPEELDESEPQELRILTPAASATAVRIFDRFFMVLISKARIPFSTF